LFKKPNHFAQIPNRFNSIPNRFCENPNRFYAIQRVFIPPSIAMADQFDKAVDASSDVRVDTPFNSVHYCRNSHAVSAIIRLRFILLL